MIIILSSEMNISPTILMWTAFSPSKSPATTPKTIAIRIWLWTFNFKCRSFKLADRIVYFRRVINTAKSEAFAGAAFRRFPFKSQISRALDKPMQIGREFEKPTKIVPQSCGAVLSRVFAGFT
jgi:hypothetical protein